MNFTYKQLSLFMLAATALASNEIWAGGGVNPQASAPGGKPQVIKLLGAEKLGIGALSKADTRKVNLDLLTLHGEYQTYLKQTSGQGPAAPAFKSRNKRARIAAGLVVIDAAASGDPKSLAADMRRLGAKKVTVFGRMVSGRLPLSAVPALKGLSSLQFARPAYAFKNSGDVTSQGDAAMRSDIARTTSGVDGTGVKVGTLSDSYNCIPGGAAAGVLSGDLPAGVTVLEEEPSCSSGTDEGRAMMEIIHDVAPGAALSFHTAFNGQADFAQGIKDLATAGAKVINDDIIYFAEPFYQDGVVAQAVDTVKGMGVAYFSSAGNQNRKAYESAFSPSSISIDIGFGPEKAHDFDPGPGTDICQKVTIPAGRSVLLDYQWDEPFASVSGAPGSASDMDIILTNAACDTALAWSVDGNTGGDPVEIVDYTNSGSTTATVGVIILHYSGPNPGRMKVINFGSGSFDEFDTKSATSFGHNSALGGLGVGAADYRNTPTFGANPPLIESFSSAGSTPILFDTAGTRLAIPVFRQQPDITAPDGVDTTFFGTDTTDAGSFPNFFGTSAAAPHAAGVAALMKDRKPTITPDDIYGALKTTAIDMDDPSTVGFDTGFDYGSGFGLIQADDALAAITFAVCDVNEDGFVSSSDISIISSRLRTMVPVGTSGDINRDGRITTQDTRGCVLQCTLSSCANPAP
jgi:hypothetical protein